ncbi:hypothetical protein Kpol_1062p41 [Vanderwaltozyma polyspora DSM 70294]|uniref:Pre-mRNA-splicing factor 18 n=1 Tax=Vanderwaltozyma polyspora (strain ATCC 22028 / DSM 70294 / BCRC 21397 / CBS 2163 / NBRC 10782 / NRRL Y-8283 / UCD 57-17) TaxID=436907 RepID=A7TK97_VANPO|nr:uncharacterized protein Kpol_1062p41 [Vanderwaltozyma polyspora DSM 70294]EDO17332.1 hypothetical protein Kpol_1062p41 [Vanderwaltozyma polyspora DSM 70294]
MNFNLNSLLQKEIAKKKREIDVSNANRAVVENGNNCKDEPLTSVQVTTVNLINSGKGELEREKQNRIDKNIERLKSRRSRINDILNSEKDIDYNININEILIENINSSKLSIKCNLYVHKLLKDWKESGHSYDLILETKRNLLPLLIKLRKNDINKEILISVSTILYHLQQDNEINQSLQSYMKLSIGTVAWPIGVTQISIHSRSAHSKLNDINKTSNIMIDERTRLWITSLKG